MNPQRQKEEGEGSERHQRSRDNRFFIMLIASSLRPVAVTATASAARRCFITISEEVAAALSSGRPIVALESTIISHGMPFPRNIEVARAVEDEVRKNGAVPATCAIIGGVPKVGLTSSDLEILAAPGNHVLKASRRDMGFAMATGAHAATTVAGTMILAHRAGLHVFATGGIGGVHRGSEVTMDVSADLLELGRTPITVVCAGVKSILDIEKTLEVLETQGVPVLGYQCEQFPAFFTNDSGIKSPMVASSALDIANMMVAQSALRLQNGLVVGVPNPSPGDSAAIQSAISAALLNAHTDGIHGARITPYLLAAVDKLTKGSSLDSNIALVMNNAAVASRIACHHSELLRTRSSSSSSGGGQGGINSARYSLSMGGHGLSAGDGSAPMHGSGADSGTDTGTGTVNGIRQGGTGGGSGGGSGGDVHATATGHTSAATSGQTPPPPRRPATTTTTTTGNSPVRYSEPAVIAFGAAIVDIIANVRAPSRTFIAGSSNPGVIATGYGGVARNIAESVAKAWTSSSSRNVCLFVQ